RHFVLYLCRTLKILIYLKYFRWNMQIFVNDNAKRFSLDMRFWVLIFTHQAYLESIYMQKYFT
ncbi:MAG TPA: hypothetical protein DC038_09340, partial [Clostridiales bacterium]|nr:hypothetical protein [Clostridiales bacterium]